MVRAAGDQGAGRGNERRARTQRIPRLVPGRSISAWISFLWSPGLFEGSNNLSLIHQLRPLHLQWWVLGSIWIVDPDNPHNFRPFVTRWSKVKSCVWQVYLPGTEFVPATSFLSCFPFIILKSLSLIHVLVFKKSYIACANFQFWGMYGWAPWPPRLLAILWCWDWKSRGVQHLLSEPSWPSDISDLILSILEATTFQLCGDVASLQNH